MQHWVCGVVQLNTLNATRVWGMALTAAIHISRMSVCVVMLCIFNKNTQSCKHYWVKMGEKTGLGSGGAAENAAVSLTLPQKKESLVMLCTDAVWCYRNFFCTNAVGEVQGIWNSLTGFQKHSTSCSAATELPLNKLKLLSSRELRYKLYSFNTCIYCDD